MPENKENSAVDIELGNLFPLQSQRRAMLRNESSNYCTAAAAAKSLQSCPTLCDPTDGSPPGSPAPGILQAIILGRVAISFSNELLYNCTHYMVAKKYSKFSKPGFNST